MGEANETSFRKKKLKKIINSGCFSKCLYLCFLEMAVHFEENKKIIILIVINRRKVYFVFKILYLYISVRGV